MHRKRTPDDYEEAFIWCIGLTNKETGCQFGVPGGTYPPIKYPSAPPPGQLAYNEQLNMEIGM